MMDKFLPSSAREKDIKKEQVLKYLSVIQENVSNNNQKVNNKKKKKIHTYLSKAKPQVS